MSRFFSAKYTSLEAYTPGEQPKDRKFVKLNTNESPFPPAPGVLEAVKAKAMSLNLYSDPELKSLKKVASAYYGLSPEQMVFTNGSDDALNYAFMAFTDKEHGAIFPDITYGFYKVFANLNGTPFEEIPLNEDFSINIGPYLERRENVFIANPNANTGIFLPISEIEKILAANRNRIVVIDEAYVEFGAESALPLIEKYDNLIVVQTFSKSRSLAGARLGVLFSNPEIVKDIETIRYSMNPYNINTLSEQIAIASILDEPYRARNLEKIKDTRSWTRRKLEELGFSVLDSKANFILAKSDRIGGRELYQRLKEKGVLVRHFDSERIREYNRISIGSEQDMGILVEKIEEILKEDGR